MKRLPDRSNRKHKDAEVGISLTYTKPSKKTSVTRTWEQKKRGNSRHGEKDKDEPNLEGS